MSRLLKSLAIACYLILLQCCNNIARATSETSMQESSDAYLRNVVSELQILNGIVDNNNNNNNGGSSSLYETGSTSRPNVQPVRIVETIVDRQIPGLSNYDLIQAQTQAVPRKPSSFLSDLSTASQNAAPTVLGFTASELAAMYKKAIERGTPVKYNTLVNTINQHTPKIYETPYQVTDVNRPIVAPATGESAYAYYFYPLHNFQHELNNPHGYRTVPDLKYDSSAPAESSSSKKETSTMNPILVGISSFLGMAVVFFITMFLYPRFINYMHFPFVATSRTSIDNEMTNIATFVIEAIDYYNKNVKKKSKLSPFGQQIKNFKLYQKR